MNIRTLVTNGVLAALYIAVTAIIAPFGFTNIQFRVSEMFNHLIVFNRKYFWGIITGVFIANLLMSTLGVFEILGLLQSVVSLTMTISVSYFVKNRLVLMGINTLIFTFNMYIVAFMLKLALGLPFLFTWLTTAIGEFIVMAIGIPVIYYLNKRINFSRLI
ncbi:MAG TPA: QueT transporter family protein [Bacillota bacterium]|nr:QueT transporter family protein [Bacillota bacterium]